ncbi:MAG: hypothetical protein KKA65_02570, partial [Nanoarchaeota archaeon]|nr:hypothetical protein [Nanoarchaeota archaeon]
MDKMGPFEAIGRITVGLSGLILGYCVAGEAVEYAKSIVQQPDAISYFYSKKTHYFSREMNCFFNNSGKMFRKPS